MTKKSPQNDIVLFLKKKKKGCKEEVAPRLPTLKEQTIAGALAGMVSKTLTAPLDRVKLFAQVEKYHHQTFHILQELLGMKRNEGVWSWWRGNIVSILKVGPESATKFVVYDLMKRYLQYPCTSSEEKNVTKRPLTLGERFIAGATAGFSSQTLVYPIDVIKTRMILSRSTEFGRAVKIILTGCQLNGHRFFTTGYISSITGSLIYSGLDLSIYETLKRKYIEVGMVSTQCGNPPGYLILVWGMCSSTIAQIISFPFSSMTASLQASDCYGHSSWETFKGVLYKKIAKGYWGLYRGLVPSLIKGVPTIGVTYVVYEYSLHFFGTSMNT